ncbi:MAG: homocysteine S-methyltransferase family protein [Proteobacteria bacterium]|nr:homocysteine S-methyltransferase family protein [Pseudomonadota bacterium]
METDGKLSTGQDLGEAIKAVDAATGDYPAYYMINCAHPDHFNSVLESGEPWLQRLRGLRSNASRMSHAELDNAEELDDGNPAELGRQYADIRRINPQINVVGGCCGTDHRHIEHIYRASMAPA